MRFLRIQAWSLRRGLSGAEAELTATSSTARAGTNGGGATGLWFFLVLVSLCAGCHKESSPRW